MYLPNVPSCPSQSIPPEETTVLTSAIISWLYLFLNLTLLESDNRCSCSFVSGFFCSVSP